VKLFVDVSVVVFGGSVIVVDTVVVVVSVEGVELVVVWAMAGTAHATSAPATSATAAAIARFRPGFTTTSLSPPEAGGNTANMRHAGKPAPPFAGPVWTHGPIPARVASHR